MPEFIHGEETHALLGACFEVYKEKGIRRREVAFLKQSFKSALSSN